MFSSVDELEDRLSAPSEALLADLAEGSGDLVILGAGGKMGPTLSLLARRGLDAAGRGDDRVLAVSRWSDPAARAKVEARGVTPVAFDLLSDIDLAGLPDAADVVFMIGAKFGTASAPSLAWAVNAALPARVAQRYSTARIAAFSTGNVYPLVPVARAVAGRLTRSDRLASMRCHALAASGSSSMPPIPAVRRCRSSG